MITINPHKFNQMMGELDDVNLEEVETGLLAEVSPGVYLTFDPYNDTDQLLSLAYKFKVLATALMCSQKMNTYNDFKQKIRELLMDEANRTGGIT